jgi:hypothetical protein
MIGSLFGSVSDALSGSSRAERREDDVDVDVSRKARSGSAEALMRHSMSVSPIVGEALVAHGASRVDRSVGPLG